MIYFDTLNKFVERPKMSSPSQEVLHLLSEKLIRDKHTTFAENATLAHFLLGADVLLGRAMANYLNELVDLLQEALDRKKKAPTTHFIDSLKALTHFITLISQRVSFKEEDEIPPAIQESWNTFASTLNFTPGRGGLMNMDEAFQRVFTGQAVEEIQSVIEYILSEYYESEEFSFGMDD
jgi:hypothetical protein